MKHVSYIIFLLVLLQSCNQTVVDFGTIPYEEKIVVDGLITAQTPLQITFSRTMPALTNVISKQPYDTTSFRLTNVSATVTTNTGDSAILHHVRQGKYVALKPNGDTLIVQQGTTYNLSASWNGKQITAHTTVPMIPELDRFSIFEFNKRSYKNGDTVSQYETYWTCSAKCPYSALFYFTYKVQKSNDLTVLDVLKDTLSSVTIYRFIDEYSQSKIKVWNLLDRIQGGVTLGLQKNH